MKFLLKILAIVAACLVLVVGGVLLYILFGDLSTHKQRVLAAVSDATGFYVASEGRFDLDVGRQVELDIENVLIGNPAWPDEHPLASLGSIRIVVDTWSIVSGPVDIELLAVSDAIVNLKQGNDGSANWIPAVTTTDDVASDASTPDPIVRQVVVENIRVGLEELGEILFYSDTAVLRLTREQADQYGFEFDGRLADPSLDKSVAAHGTLVFDESPYEIGRVRFEIEEARFESSGETAASAVLAGVLEADLTGDKPALGVEIDVSELAVQSAKPASETATDNASDERLFSSEPLAMAWLASLDLDANISVDTANLDGSALSEIRAVAAIEDAALAISTFEFATEGGTLSGSLHLIPADDVFDFNVEIDAANLRLAALADADQDPASLPPVSGILQLSGRGASVHDIMASANGSLTGRQGAGQLNLQAINALFGDFLTSVLRTLNPLAEERTYSNIDCGILGVEIKDGIASIEELALQSDRLTIVSSGEIELATEAIDLNVNTKSREGLGLSVGGVANSFVKIGGTLKEPSLGVDAAGSVTTTGAAVATGGLSLLAKGLWNRLSSEVDLCKLPDEEAGQE